MATLDDILPDDKVLAQLRLASIAAGTQERERVDACRRDAVNALEGRAGVYLLDRSTHDYGYIVPRDNGFARLKLKPFIKQIDSISASNGGRAQAIPVDETYTQEVIEHGERVIRLFPNEQWPAVQGSSDMAVIDIEYSVGASAAQVAEILSSGWERYMLLMLSGFYDFRFASGREGQPYDHSIAERHAQTLARPMAV